MPNMRIITNHKDHRSSDHVRFPPLPKIYIYRGRRGLDPSIDVYWRVLELHRFILKVVHKSTLHLTSGIQSSLGFLKRFCWESSFEEIGLRRHEKSQIHWTITLPWVTTTMGCIRPENIFHESLMDFVADLFDICDLQRIMNVLHLLGTYSWCISHSCNGFGACPLLVQTNDHLAATVLLYPSGQTTVRPKEAYCFPEKPNWIPNMIRSTNK